MNKKLRSLRYTLPILFAIIAVVGITTADAGGTPPIEGPKVTLCHRTSAVNNPYGPKAIEVDQAAVETEGHSGHTGPVFPADNWGDIIPPFTGFAGLNWDITGQALWDNDCQVVSTTRTTEGTTTTTEGGPVATIETPTTTTTVPVTAPPPTTVAPPSTTVGPIIRVTPAGPVQGNPNFTG